MARDDIHRPSLLDPAEYDFICAFYQGDSPWIGQAYKEEMRIYEDLMDEGPMIFDGNFSYKNTCDHCGAAFNHGVLFRHLPTHELIHVGHICAANTVGLPDRAAKVKKQAEKEAAENREHEKRELAAVAWKAENYKIVDALNALPDDASGFLKDIARNLYKWGTLTPNQVRAATNALEREDRIRAQKAEREIALKDTPALTGGRQVLTGEILSTKWQDSDFGTTLKMLVQLPDGNRVYGTVPAAIQGTDDDALRGKRVNFTATVKPSDKDAHFGYFSRPAGASIL